MPWRIFCPLLTHILLLVTVFSSTACEESQSAPISTGPKVKCQTTALESQLDTALDQVVTDAPFTFAVERKDGHRYVKSVGASSLQTPYKSASTAKLVTAVIILQLVDKGLLNLADKPRDNIGSTWPVPVGHVLHNATLAQLLSFTSGFNLEPGCLYQPLANFQNCVFEIATLNMTNPVTPGTEFYYAGSHLQIAGLMAIKAAGVASWQQLFNDFKTQTGLFADSKYNSTSTLNPLLAGGMEWTGENYLDFLKDYSQGKLLPKNLQAMAMSNQSLGLKIANSPVLTALQQDWRYGFGQWLECSASTFASCAAITRYSSPGAYGAYPYWDTSLKYFGLVARQGQLGTFSNGWAIENTVRSLVEKWTTCY